MDATGVEILFLERSDKGEYIKADIFDHPTAFATTEVTVAADPTEALVSSLNKYGTVELDLSLIHISFFFSQLTSFFKFGINQRYFFIPVKDIRH